jgi:hypothetical protein
MRIFLGIILAGFIATSAQGAAPTEAEKAACDPDARSLCAGAILNVFSKKDVYERVYECLKLKKEKLSPPCRAAFRAHGM